MVEACIKRATGEVIVVKPLASLWSPDEFDGPKLMVVKLDDPDLHVPDEGRAYPYAVHGPAKKVFGEMVRPPARQISRWKVDCRDLAPAATVRRVDLKESLEAYPKRGEMST